MPRSHPRPDTSLPASLKSETVHAEPDQDVQLTVVLPRRVRQALLLHATAQGTTARSVVLRLLKDAGIADVDEADLVDRRSTPNTARRTAA